MPTWSEPLAELPTYPTGAPGWWRVGHRREAARACHSLVVRTSGRYESGQWQHRLERCGKRWPEIHGHPLWEARQPPEPPHLATGRLAFREAIRPLHPGAPPLRVVVVRSGDGAIDLVLVARRTHIPRPALERLAAALVADEQEPPEPPRQAPERTPARLPAVPWGLGDPERAGAVGITPVALPKDLSIADQLLVAAAAVTLSRYDPGRTPMVGVLAPDRDREVAAYSLEVDEGTRVADLRRRLDHAWPAGGELPGPPLPGPPVGMAFGQAVTGHRYLPCLAPVFPLTVWWERQPDGSLGGACQYDEGVVSAAIAERFAAHLAHTAAQLTHGGRARLGALPPLPEAAAREIVRRGATPPRRPHRMPGPASIHQRFTAVARQHPDAVAVTDDRVRLTYRELDAKADRLAAGLRTLGVAPGRMIGVCLERDSGLVTTLLAVLKAECAYVPMDVRYPDERLRYTAVDAKAPVVVSTDRFPAVDGVRVVDPETLCSLGSAAAVAGAAPSGSAATAEGALPAYVIYTSGSTGRPKGVVIPHRNVLALLEATVDEFALGPDDVWTMFHSSAFDFSVWEMWGCLLTGGRLVVVPHGTTRATEEFHDLLVRERVTVLNQTPSAFSPLIEADRHATAALSVRLVIFGGEPLDGRMLLPWFARHPYSTCRLVNMFGITETTVHVTAQTVTPAAAARGSRSVGRALPGWSVSIRDEHGRICPAGAAGEIYVGGAGVASHYLGQPELTAQRFVVDQFTGDRVYRSGDTGRMRPDGAVEHLGRLDSQVKVRGHRIELDEIRKVLLDAPAVSAAVAVCDGAPGNHAGAQIHAYVVLVAGGTTGGAYAHARRLLPDYMLPATVTAIESVPLTINGKLDAARLPPPRQDEQVPADAGRPAGEPAGRDPLADRILRLWAHHLEVEVGLDGNFFELGGNSLLAIRMLGDLRREGLPRVPTRQFYLNSVAGQFVELVRRLHGEPPD